MVIASRTSRVVVAAAEPVFLGMGSGLGGFTASGLTPKKWAKRMSFHTPSGTLTRNVQVKVMASEREG